MKLCRCCGACACIRAPEAPYDDFQFSAFVRLPTYYLSNPNGDDYGLMGRVRRYSAFEDADYFVWTNAVGPSPFYGRWALRRKRLRCDKPRLLLLLGDPVTQPTSSPSITGPDDFDSLDGQAGAIWECRPSGWTQIEVVEADWLSGTAYQLTDATVAGLTWYDSITGSSVSAPSGPPLDDVWCEPTALFLASSEIPTAVRVDLSGWSSWPQSLDGSYALPLRSSSVVTYESGTIAVATYYDDFDLGLGFANRQRITCRAVVRDAGPLTMRQGKITIAAAPSIGVSSIEAITCWDHGRHWVGAYGSSLDSLSSWSYDPAYLHQHTAPMGSFATS